VTSPIADGSPTRERAFERARSRDVGGFARLKKRAGGGTTFAEVTLVCKLIRLECLAGIVLVVLGMLGCSAGAPAAGGERRDVDVDRAPAVSAAADPIVAPDETWTWVPVDGTQCADGSPVGLGISPSHKTKNLVIFLQGGGACWDEASCGLGLAANVHGYNALSFAIDVAISSSGTPLDRTLPTNPLKDDSFVFIPYCTGDIHGGQNVATYGGQPFHHAGFANVTLDMARVAATFPDVERVVVAGISAGGFGAAYNFGRIREMFPRARAFLVDDSGPPLPPPFATDAVMTRWKTAWHLDDTLPPDCPECRVRIDAIFDHYAAKYPDAKVALLSYRQDPVISLFYGVRILEYASALDALVKPDFVPHPGFHYYFADGLSHVTLIAYRSLAVKNVTLASWLDAMLSDSPDWVDVSP
jgi:hypothetical protein